MPSTRSVTKRLRDEANTELLKQSDPKTPFNCGIILSHVTEIGWSTRNVMVWILGPALEHLKAWKAAVIDNDDQYPHLLAALGAPEEWKDLSGILAFCNNDEEQTWEEEANLTSDDKILVTLQLTARAAMDIAKDTRSDSEWNAAYIANKEHC